MRPVKPKQLLILGLVLTCVALMGAGGPRGLNFDAFEELSDAGVDKYIGEFTPASSTDVGDGWTKHTFDPDAVPHTVRLRIVSDLERGELGDAINALLHAIHRPGRQIEPRPRGKIVDLHANA